MEALLEKLRSRGFAIIATGGKLFVEPGSKLTDANRDLIRANKLALLQALANPSKELEAILCGIQREAEKLTRDARLLASVSNLLNDCRDIWKEGHSERALKLANHLETSTPEYFHRRG